MPVNTMLYNINNADLLTLGQTAKILNVHGNTLRRWSDNGKIRTIRINSRGDRRFRMEDINHYLETFNPYR